MVESANRRHPSHRLQRARWQYHHCILFRTLQRHLKRRTVGMIRLSVFFAQKTAPDTVFRERGGKNRILFFTGARSLPCRSYASGGARYLQPDLMLLTHARCALKDPHGCFGISIHAFVLSRTGHRHGMEIMDAKNRSVYGISACFSAGESTVSHCCVAQ